MIFHIFMHYHPYNLHKTALSSLTFWIIIYLFNSRRG